MEPSSYPMTWNTSKKQWARVFPIFHRKLSVPNKDENVKGLFTVHFMLHLSK